MSPGKPSLAAIHLAHDLLVVDSLEELTRDRNAGALAAHRQLVEEAVSDELQPFLDQLVVNLSLAFDLFRGLKLRGEAGLELSEADVVETRGVDVISGDAPAGGAADFNGSIESPIGVWRVIDGNEDFPIWHDSALGRCGSLNRYP